MLAIRMQRTGRKGHAQFRVVVQDSRFSPTSGRVVEYIGSYNPHTKATTLDKAKAETYLSNGARPSDRVAQLLKNEGVKLPAWVKEPTKGERTIRHPEKLRRNRPAQEAPAEATEPTEPETAVEQPAEAEAASEPQAEVAAEADAQAAATENEAPAEPAAEEPAADSEAEAETPTETDTPAAS
jgi:small subunit ribosomal protein S16